MTPELKKIAAVLLAFVDTRCAARCDWQVGVAKNVQRVLRQHGVNLLEDTYRWIDSGNKCDAAMLEAWLISEGLMRDARSQSGRATILYLFDFAATELTGPHRGKHRRVVASWEIVNPFGLPPRPGRANILR